MFLFTYYSHKLGHNTSTSGQYFPVLPSNLLVIGLVLFADDDIWEDKDDKEDEHEN